MMASADEKVNGFKLMRLIIDCGTEALRNVFKKIHPGDLHTILGINYSNILPLKTSKVIKPLQWEKLYPTPPKLPNIKEFDITLLFLLLRNACGVSPPGTGWNDMPDSTDISLAANIVRVRLFRNQFFAHIPCTSISKTEFEDRWKEVSATLVNLGISQAKIDRLKKEQFLEEVSLKSPDFRSKIEWFNQKWCKGTREWVFNQVDKWFNQNPDDNRPLIITGEAGMGKTVIAAVICERFSEQQGACFFCQIDNDSYNNQNIILQSLAKQLSNVLPKYKNALIEKLISNEQELDDMTVEDLFSLLFTEPLTGIHVQERYLIVIDSVDEIKQASWSDFVDLIAGNCDQLPSFIRFLFTSRPDKKFSKLSLLKLLADDEQNLQDIRQLFHEKLSLSDEKMDGLVHKSAGVMLHAVSYLVNRS